MADPVVVAEEFVREPGTPRQLIQRRVETNSFDEAGIEKLELDVAEKIMAVLRRHYGGHGWAVDVSFQKGGVAIALPILMGGNWVYFIRGRDLTQKAVKDAGGEILERYRMPRGAFDLGSFLEARRRYSIMTGAAKRVPS